MYDPKNIFARILRGEIPCDKVYEDEFALAFRDISPKAPVHILVIPKAAYIDLADFSANAKPAEIVGFFKAVAKITAQENLTENGFRSIANTGTDGGQEVPHFHLHILGGAPVGPMVSEA